MFRFLVTISPKIGQKISKVAIKINYAPKYSIFFYETLNDSLNFCRQLLCRILDKEEEKCMK